MSYEFERKINSAEAYDPSGRNDFFDGMDELLEKADKQRHELLTGVSYPDKAYASRAVAEWHEASGHFADEQSDEQADESESAEPETADDARPMPVTLKNVGANALSGALPASYRPQK